MTNINLDSLQNWVGRTQVAEASITQPLVSAYQSTLEPYLHNSEGEALPGLHWCLAPDPANAPMADLGPDGHPKTGGFLPRFLCRVECGQVESSRYWVLYRWMSQSPDYRQLPMYN